MTLLDAQPVKPRSPIVKYALVVVPLVAALGSLAAYRFWNYTEERAVVRFLATLQQGNYQEGYRLWQPSPSYSYQDFLHDWGEKGDYGKVREFQIVSSASKGSRTVIVTVRINQVDPPLDLLVDRETKGLAYSAF